MEIVRKTVENDEEYLRQISTDVDFEKEDYIKYIDILREYLSKNSAYALAPVQIGIPKRLIYIRNTTSDMSKNTDGNYNEEKIYINPIIIKAYGHTKFLEGCESCRIIKNGKDIFFTGVIDRPYKIDIEYQDINGEKKEKTLEGFETTVFCHEYDHLNGILHMDKAKEIFEMTLEEMKEYRTEHKYEILSKDDEYIIKNKTL